MIYIGDVHGKIYLLTEKIKYIYNKNFICLGDFGIGFTNINLDLLNNILKQNKNFLYIIRGNHDNPEYFNNKWFSSNIKFVKDYTILNLENKKILCIGGGTSIDKKRRIVNFSYWENENIIYNEEKIKKLKKYKFDVLCTHVPCPDIFFNPQGDKIVEDWAGNDIELQKTLEEEKNILRKIKSQINFYVWISGHFHINQTIKNENKIYKILDELELWEL